MASIQEIIALLIVALVGGNLIWHRLRRKSGSCGNCASAAAPPKEATVHFHRRRPAEPKAPEQPR